MKKTPPSKAKNFSRKASPKKLRFVDLFAGIGGMRIAFERAGGECVLTSEIDDTALITYKINANPGSDHRYVGDICGVANTDIPRHEILVAGFPCQPYSIAGLRKGLKDPRGEIFTEILRFIDKGNPRAFLLENVKGLIGHDGGKTFDYMKDQVARSGKYEIHWAVLNSQTHANVPQNRERIFLVGLRKDVKNAANFQFPAPIPLTKSIRDLLEPDSSVEKKYFYTDRFDCYAQLKAEMTSFDTVYQWRRQYVRSNKSNVCPTLTANMGAGGHNVPLVLTKKGIRKLTPRECARFQGFPDSFALPAISDSKLYHQFGNSVTVPLITRIAKAITSHLEG